MVRRDIKFARSLSIATKLKFPFPHMVAVVVKERSGGGLQLLTQGTADIILDSCIEYWDGHDLCPLSASDRYGYPISRFFCSYLCETVFKMFSQLRS